MCAETFDLSVILARSFSVEKPPPPSRALENPPQPTAIQNKLSHSFDCSFVVPALSVWLSRQSHTSKRAMASAEIFKLYWKHVHDDLTTSSPVIIRCRPDQELSKLVSSILSSLSVDHVGVVACGCVFDSSDVPVITLGELGNEAHTYRPIFTFAHTLLGRGCVPSAFVRPTAACEVSLSIFFDQPPVRFSPCLLRSNWPAMDLMRMARVLKISACRHCSCVVYRILISQHCVPDYLLPKGRVGCTLPLLLRPSTNGVRSTQRQPKIWKLYQRVF